jgi:hypothetical protein
LCLPLKQYFRSMANSPIRESQWSTRPWMAAAGLQFGLWKKSRTGEMTTNSYQAEQGKKLFGIGILFFAQGFAWFGYSSPGGIFTLHSLNLDVAFFRAEIVIGAMVAAYGMLVWRSASRKLSFANYIIVLPFMALLLLGASNLSEWVYFLDQQHRGLSMNDLKVGVVQITFPVCMAVLGAWWADSTYTRARFHEHLRSSRFVK